jgi:hypothetical protein
MPSMRENATGEILVNHVFIQPEYFKNLVHPGKIAKWRSPFFENILSAQTITHVL